MLAWATQAFCAVPRNIRRRSQMCIDLLMRFGTDPTHTFTDPNPVSMFAHALNSASSVRTVFSAREINQYLLSLGRMQSDIY